MTIEVGVPDDWTPELALTMTQQTAVIDRSTRSTVREVAETGPRKR